MIVDPLLVDTPAGLPMGCICGSSTGPFVDTGVNLGVFLNEEIPGPWVYLCPKCVAAVAGLCGYASPEQAREADRTVAALEEEAAGLRAALEEARSPENRLVRLDDVLAHERAVPLPAVADAVTAAEPKARGGRG